MTFIEPLWTDVTLQLADGSIVTGVVHGSGGVIRDTRRTSAVQYVSGLIYRANEGYKLPVYEPKKGHVKLHIGMSTQDEGESRIVDLRGAKVRA